MCPPDVLGSRARRRPLWRATTITTLIATLLLFTLGLGVSPVSAGGEDLLGSGIAASQGTLAVGGKVTLTVTLRNAGSTAATAEVTVQLPAELAYVPDSATAGGKPEGNGASWSGVAVPAGGSLPLSLQATPAGAITANKDVSIVAAIMSDQVHFLRFVAITLVPGSAPPPAETNPLSASYKMASRHMVASGDSLDYTIKLVNSSASNVQAQVVDTVPAEMEYAAGSATMGGSYDSSSRRLTWSNVAVAAGAEVSLTFGAKGTATAPVMVDNAATISVAGAGSLERHAFVWLFPNGASLPHPLAASFKTASSVIAVSGEAFDYTIRLVNSGTNDTIAQVIDPLPAQIEYVPSTATMGGTYDPDARQITWSDVRVPAGKETSLVFRVIGTTSGPAVVDNTATITADGQSIRRTASVALKPKPDTTIDRIPPVVRSLTIGDKDVLDSPQVTLHLSAEDNVAVTKMYLREWQLASTPFPPHWEVVKSSGWIPYAADIPWTLGTAPGTHFVGGWVADAAENASHLGPSAIDFASVISPSAHLPQGSFAAYMVYYDGGQSVQVTLSPASGSADLFGWHPGNFWWPDHAGNTVSFTTPRSGVYVFVANARTEATYNLSIQPAGGPRIGSSSTALKTAGSTSSAEIVNPIDNPLNLSGLDPLGSPSAQADAPSQPTATIYLPLIRP